MLFRSLPLAAGLLNGEESNGEDEGVDKAYKTFGDTTKAKADETDTEF